MGERFAGMDMEKMMKKQAQDHAYEDFVAAQAKEAEAVAKQKPSKLEKFRSEIELDKTEGAQLQEDHSRTFNEGVTSVQDAGNIREVELDLGDGEELKLEGEENKPALKN